MSERMTEMSELKDDASAGRMVVHVEKAELPLKNGESMNEFRERLQGLASEHFKGLDIGAEIESLWVDEFYPDNVVVSASWKRKRGDSLKEQAHPEGWSHFQVVYTSKNSEISFGDTVEVERRVTWVKKSKVQKREQESLWKGLL